MTEIVRNVNASDWKEFLAITPAARIYHTPEWQLFLERTFPYKSRTIFSRDDSGRITGMLPLFKIESRITGKRLVSAPFSHICGPIGSPDTMLDLLNNARDIQEKEDCSVLEIRDRVHHRDFHSTVSFSTYVCDLTRSQDDLWNRLSKGSVQRAIKKTIKEGVSVEITNNGEDLKIFYELNAMTKKNVGVPCHPWVFFQNLSTCLKDFVSLYIARFEGEIIGGVIMVYFKDIALAGYGAAHPAYLKYHPYHALIWKSILDAHSNGYLSYDSGRASIYDHGLIEFKTRWGTREIPLEYSYYPAETEPRILRTGLLYHIGTKIFQQMPMGMYTKLSDRLFGEFG